MISLRDVQQAAKVIRQTALQTPLILSPTLSRKFNAHIYLKLENFQVAGSFKIRGATYKLNRLREKIGSRGVVAVSAGNHAQGVALAAKALNVPATIVMPEWASITKQEATRGYGGEVILAGRSLEDSLKEAIALTEKGMTLIHPFDDPDIIAGQGTIALEIFNTIERVDVIISPVGGGGLISGVACTAKSIESDIRIIGVQARACPSAYDSFRKGRRVTSDATPSIADGISVKHIGKLNFEMIRKYVDDMVLVEEEQIAAAMLMLFEQEKILVEGAGAVPLAALDNGHIDILEGSNVVLLISGGNVDSPLLGRIINQGLVKNGRVVHLSVMLSDTPGALAELLALIARMKANVLHIYHERNMKGFPMNVSCVELELETRGIEHVEEISRRLHASGHDVEIR